MSGTDGVSNHSQSPPAPGLPDDTAAGSKATTGTRTFVRGSSLLFSGRLVSLALNLVVQVIVVRYFAKSDYGAFAYGIGVASIGATVVLLGMEKAIGRFVALFQERRDLPKAFGAIALATGIVAAMSVALVALCYGFRESIEGSLVTDPLAFSLLLVLILLAPIDAFDNLLQQLLAIFVGPRAIFFRRHLLAPGLKLAAILLVILMAGGVQLFAWAYLGGALLGVASYVAMLARAWQQQGLLGYLNPRTWHVPTREFLGYSLPLFSSEIVLIVRGSLTLVLLEYLQSTAAVAEYRAVLPFAKLNTIVLESFSLLFFPLASRLFARNDRHGMNELYWQTALWTTVFSFPVFAVTFALSQPVTVLLLGDEYVESGPVLALLAVGFYSHAALGFNQFILRVCGKVRYIVSFDILAAIAGLAFNLILIPRYGALGAAIASASTFLVHNMLGQLGLWLGDTGVRLREWRYLSVYLLVALLSATLLIVQSVLAPPLYLGVGAAVASSLLVLRLTRRLIRIEETFPELLRLPFMRVLVS